MAKKLAGKSLKELEKTLTQKRKALQEFRFGMAGSRTRNVKQARTLRREVAQILTEMNARAKTQE